MRRPFVWFACGLMAGIVSAVYLNTVSFAAALIAVAAASVLFVVRKGILEFIYVPILCLVGFIICSSAINSHSRREMLLDNKDAYITGTVRSYYITDNGNTSINLETNRIVLGDGIVEDKMKVLVTATNVNVSSGDVIRVRGRTYGYDKPSNPYQMNYEMYMLSNGYSCNMWAESVENTGIHNESVIYKIEAYREKVNRFFDKIMPEDTASVLKALTTGYKYDINENTRENYKNMGISHLLAVSGIHVSVIAGAVFFIFSKIFGGSKRKAMPFAAAFLILYLFFTGVSPSAVRAVLMTVTFYIGYIISRSSDKLNLTAFSAFIMLLINPIYLWNISFQLSYIGITAVGLTDDIIKDHKDIGPISKALMFSLLVWIITTPLTMYYFGGISIIAPITNIIFVPYLSFSTGLGLLSAIMSIFDEGFVAASIAGKMIFVYNTLADKIKTDGFYIDTLKPSLSAVVIIYAFMLLVIYFRNNKRKLLVTTGIFSSVSIAYTGMVLSAPSEIVFFDAGQGDSSAVLIPGKFMAVIDGGPEGEADMSVIPYIESKAGKADILFITHTDADHLSGALDIIQNGLTGKVVVSKYADNKMVNKIIDEAKVKNIPVILASAGDEFDTQWCDIECIYPIGTTSKNENETSLVLKVTIGNTEVLFTGDITSEIEYELLKSDIDCDIIKIAHHGSKTSSSEDFLKMTGAEFAVIEAGENNIYGFPHNDVIQRLEELNVNTFFTGKDGAVIFYVDKSGYIEDIKTFRK